MRIAILGISAFYHDSAAALIVDGKIIAAAQEERFSRIRHDAGFPTQAVQYVLKEYGISYDDLTAVAFYDKPLLKFERLLETYHAFAPKGLPSFIRAIPVWIKEKLFTRRLLRKHLSQFGNLKIPLLFTEHHLSHAASAYFPSPFEEAAVLTIDGVGEWATTTLSHGKSGQIRIMKELRFPHSLGLLYSAFTYFLGFRVNSGEYKLMGLTPYGNLKSAQGISFKEKILSVLVDVRDDGSFLLNMNYFRFATELTMTHDKKWEKLFGFSRREPESAITQQHMDLALAIQDVTESIVIRLAQTAKQITGCKNLAMAGGVALNCVANTKLFNTGMFDQIWIQPAAGDAGGALGAALAAYHIGYEQERKEVQGANLIYLGPGYSNAEIERTLNKYEASSTFFESDELVKHISRKIDSGKIVGWFQDRMEFGPRALGNRSILADPRNLDMQRTMNVEIKSREEFRPFAPSMLEEEFKYFYDEQPPSEYMLFVSSLKTEFRFAEPADYRNADIHDRLYHLRSRIPAVTHIDYSSRIQTVTQESNPKFWQLLTEFKKISGIGMLVNTSFNVRGEPMVCTPDDAYLDFMRMEMDYLVMGNYVLCKSSQKKLDPKELEKLSFSLD